MDMFLEFLATFKDYLIEVLPYLAAGLFLSGLVNEFVPARLVERHLGGRGIKPILYATVIGTILPICCIGSLPVAVSLRQKGARLGPVLAFLVATPATSITALLVSYSLLGIKFTVFLFFGVIAMGLLAGLIGNLIKFKPGTFACPAARTATDPVCGMNVDVSRDIKTEYGGNIYYFCCRNCQQKFEASPGEYTEAVPGGFLHRMKRVLRYAFVDMVKEIGPEMLLGLALAALVAAVTPVGEFIGKYFGGALGYVFALVFGIMIYICSTASVPLVDAFMKQGMNPGAGMVLLMVGPVTSWGTILVLRKEFGGRVLLVYLATVSAAARALG